MSWWTYVHGAVEVDTCESSNEMSLSKVYSVIEKLPKVTGSEGNMNIYVNLINGHNTYEGGYNYSKEWQTKVMITLEGSLRDRYLNDTLREVVSFLNRLSKRLIVDYCSCTVQSYRSRIDVIGNWNLSSNYVYK